MTSSYGHLFHRLPAAIEEAGEGQAHHVGGTCGDAQKRDQVKDNAEDRLPRREALRTVPDNPQYDCDGKGDGQAQRVSTASTATVSDGGEGDEGEGEAIKRSGEPVVGFREEDVARALIQ